MRILFTIVFLLFTTFIYCQKSTLLQNVNFRAKELKHSLNKTEDSLILEGERTIYKVEIFNNDFEQSHIVKDSKIKIPLNNIPLGRFVVEAALPDRLIVITLLRNKPISLAINTPRQNRKVSLFGKAPSVPVKTIYTPKNKTIEKIAVVGDKKVKTINENVAETQKVITNIDKELKISKTSLKNSDHKIVEAYWIVYKTNNGLSSGKEMRFGDQVLVDKMISNINLDKKIVSGKLNELTIWEVYDITQFLRYKIHSTIDLNSDSDSFNTKPYFKVENDSTKR